MFNKKFTQNILSYLTEESVKKTIYFGKEVPCIDLDRKPRIAWRK